MRRTRMRPGKRKTKYARRVRDFDFMGWVKTLPCVLFEVEGTGPCSAGLCEADHAGLRGAGQKAPDDTCIPLCSDHHLDRHACTGFFRGRSKQWKRDWRLGTIATIQEQYAKLNW